ncbi:MAG: hypothetical protein DRH24_15055 [Deltaproteobacteria bacterium]|nr:MAG: hypothetical protein DRH24_15055 [Deltaproteobacteria bacterium]
MDFFKEMQYVDGLVFSWPHAERKIFELEIKKRLLNCCFTKGLKVSATQPLARWRIIFLYRLNGQAANLVSSVTVHGCSGKPEVADYSWSG